MIHRIPVFFFLGALASSLLAQETAHVVEPVASGTPAKPLPKLEIPAENILSTKVQNLEDHKLILQEVVPMDLPPPPEPAAPVEMTAERRAAFEARKLQIKQRRLLSLSVAVYRSERYQGKVRTLFQWRSDDRQREFKAWSNVDAVWLSGYANFQTATTFYSVFMIPSEFDIDRREALVASRGRKFTPPQIPELPVTANSFVVSEGEPTPEELAPIVAIHDLFKTEGEKLRLTYEKRILAQKEEAAYLKAHPPKPEDIVVRYWRIQKSEEAVPQTEGGEQ